MALNIVLRVSAHRDLFKANPDNYAPQFDGSCAMNMSNRMRREADPLTWTIFSRTSDPVGSDPHLPEWSKKWPTSAVGHELS
jgi:hypothetical protein